MAFNNINIFSLARRINRPLILDGAMGSFLQQKKLERNEYLWMSLLNIKAPEKVLSVHKAYIKAGADIITTNTFRTNPAAIEKYGSKISAERIVKESVEITKSAIDNAPILIAGSNPPAEDCYQIERILSSKKLQFNHYKHIELLYNNGSHFILNETQSHLDEILIICKFCLQNNIPYVMSLYITEELKILSGENVNYVIKIIMEHDPLAISINCIKPKTFMKFYRKNKLDFNWGVYLNCGKGSITNPIIKCGINSQEYQNNMKKILEKTPSFIGACCGSSPKHIRQLRKLLDEKNDN
jgi:methionine synthase I (cobalamin-dependent)